MNTITLSASAKYGFGGKQFVAQIKGRDSKFTFKREFLGHKEGKRGEGTEVIVDEAGLYEERDIDRKGNAVESYYIVFEENGELKKQKISKEKAMEFAKQLDKHSVDFYRAAIEIRVENLKKQIESGKAKGELETPITLEGQVGRYASGQVVTRGELITEREKLVAEYEAKLNPTETDARAEALAQVQSLIALHGITAEELF